MAFLFVFIQLLYKNSSFTRSYDIRIVVYDHESFIILLHTCCFDVTHMTNMNLLQIKWFVTKRIQFINIPHSVR